MKQTLLSSLAFLKIHSDSTNEIFLDNFIPFIVHSVGHLKDEAISVEPLQEDLFQSFGLRIPQSVVTALLYRARRRGLVTLKDKVFYRIKGQPNDFMFTSVQEKVGRIYSALIENFMEYCKTKYNTIFSEEAAEKLILSFIGYNQPFFYRHPASEKVIPVMPLSSEDEKFMVANYIYEARQSKPEIYEYLDTLVKGFMIANVLYLPDIYDVKKKFQKTRIYLDTSFVIHALGYNGEHLRIPRLELLEILYKCNAKICCFNHTVEEIEGILEACSQNLKNTSDTPFGRSVRYFVSMGYSPSDIRLLISHLKENIQKLRIEIVPTPGYENHSYVIDEDALFKYLEGRIKYSRKDAIHKDVASISAVYRLRRNNYSIYLENSSAVFVTTNNTLTSAANDFFFLTNDSSIAPPCVTDFFLTNLLWLKIPNHAPDLPMRKIIADSYAAIQPDEKLMAKWVNEIKKLEAAIKVTEEDYYFMRSSDEVYQALMEITKGNDEAITSGTVPQILERAKEIVRQEVEEKYQFELSKRQESEATIAYLRAEESRREAERKNRVDAKSRSFARNAVKLLRVLALLLLVFGFVLTLPLDLIVPGELVNNALSQFPHFILPLVFLFMLVIGVLGQYYGTTVDSWMNSLEIMIQKKAYKYLWSLSN